MRSPIASMNGPQSSTTITLYTPSVKHIRGRHCCCLARWRIERRQKGQWTREIILSFEFLVFGTRIYTDLHGLLFGGKIVVNFEF